MRTVDITIRVVVPDGCDGVAINEDGTPVAFSEFSEPCTLRHTWAVKRGFINYSCVENWRDTITRVKS